MRFFFYFLIVAFVAHLTIYNGFLFPKTLILILGVISLILIVETDNYALSEMRDKYPSTYKKYVARTDFGTNRLKIGFHFRLLTDPKFRTLHLNQSLVKICYVSSVSTIILIVSLLCLLIIGVSNHHS